MFVYGQLRGLPRSHLSDALVNASSRLVANAGQADTIVVSRRMVGRCLTADGRLALPFAAPAAARLLGESGFSRLLQGEGDAAPGPYTIEEVARHAALPVETCRALALFDVIGTGGDRFAYRDLAVARQVAALLAQGSAPRRVVEAAWTLGARGLRLSEMRLAPAPWGEVMHRVGDSMARLDGQFALVFDEFGHGAEASLAQALASEEEGALEEAERWYRRAVQADRRNPLAAYNLGNVLAALGRDAEAVIAFQQALSLDPDLAEAAFNRAVLVEARGETERAISLYRETVASHPAYGQALYNLARLLTQEERHAEALPLWERFVALSPTDPDVGHARRAAALCRMSMRAAALGGPTPA